MRHALETQLALSKVTLDVFTAQPSTITAFGGATLTWDVNVPSDVSDVLDIEIHLNGTPVSPSGELLVTPVATTSYSITASTLGVFKTLGTVTVQVDLTACVALSAEPVFAITEVIKYQIEQNNSLYFHSTSDIVSIQGDRMIVSLHLGYRLKKLPDASVDIDASFALDVVPMPTGGQGSTIQYDFHELAPTGQSIQVNISVAWYLWLIPGAIIALPLIISDAEAKTQAQFTDVITEIVKGLNGWFHQSYVQPPTIDKHDAGFYVNPQGDQRFWINFCPVPPGPTRAGPSVSRRGARPG